LYAGFPIALIDDDRDWVETLAEYLRRQGFAPRVAYNGTEGLALLEGGTLPLDLVDYHMNGMDGLELLRRLRQLRRAEAVFVVSNADDPGLAARVRAKRGRGHFSKTVSLRLLLEAVRRAAADLRPEPPRRPPHKRWQRLLTGPRSRRGVAVSS
jgi:CheY-like chemotaxis protein